MKLATWYLNIKKDVNQITTIWFDWNKKNFSYYLCTSDNVSSDLSSAFSKFYPRKLHILCQSAFFQNECTMFLGLQILFPLDISCIELNFRRQQICEISCIFEHGLRNHDFYCFLHKLSDRNRRFFWLFQLEQFSVAIFPGSFRKGTFLWDFCVILWSMKNDKIKVKIIRWDSTFKCHS